MKVDSSFDSVQETSRRPTSNPRPATPAESEADQAAGKTSDADRKANGHERMSPYLQRRVGAQSSTA